ncbi:helix-turn-helix domain-containing protein [Enhygromyxa salina]|uniref:helix-turn-helix domain-containing protein n=1 Tax=Enhygromyxa salina TaxID=215803 RepID=UPI003B8A94CF
MTRGPTVRKLSIQRRTRRDLKLLARRQRAPYVIIVRARIVLLASQGVGTEEIARRLSVSSRTVRKWKARFADDVHMDNLEDRERSGRPNLIKTEIRCRLDRRHLFLPVDDN